MIKKIIASKISIFFNAIKKKMSNNLNVKNYVDNVWILVMRKMGTFKYFEDNFGKRGQGDGTRGQK